MAKTATINFSISGTNTDLSGNSQSNIYIELLGASDKPVSYLNGTLVISVAASGTETVTPPAGGWSGSLNYAICAKYVASTPDSTATVDGNAENFQRLKAGLMGTSLTITNNTASEAEYQICFFKES